VRHLPDDYVQAWVDRAERDLQIARVNHREELYDAAALFCQQAVEKILKAHFVATQDREPPKVHRLMQLAELAGLPDDLADDLHDLESDYIRTRYPDLGFAMGPGVYEADGAAHKIELAQQVISTIKSRLAEVLRDGADGSGTTESEAP
jgi:HEPN domain-containing protein